MEEGGDRQEWMCSAPHRPVSLQFCTGKSAGFINWKTNSRIFLHNLAVYFLHMASKQAVSSSSSLTAASVSVPPDNFNFLAINFNNQHSFTSAPRANSSRRLLLHHHHHRMLTRAHHFHSIPLHLVVWRAHAPAQGAVAGLGVFVCCQCFDHKTELILMRFSYTNNNTYGSPCCSRCLHGWLANGLDTSA